MITTKKLVYAALFLASGVLLPQIFHLIGGASMGATLLPIHIPVIIGGLLLGPVFGSVFGIFSPLLSFLITSMPAADRLPFMVIELFVYGLVSGALSKKSTRVFPCLIPAMVLGRAANAISLAVAFYILDMENAAPAAAWAAIIKGLPGIVVQLILIPPVVYALRRYLFEGRNLNGKKDTCR